jgi:putative Ca2+/H+ antiporter (TMEM165/GDT1 family)
MKGAKAPVDWSLLLRAFGLVFLAELGDKTQISTMLLSAQCKSPWIVFLGAAMALVLNAALGALFGDAITRLIPPYLVQKGAGVVFIVLGALLFFGKS